MRVTHSKQLFQSLQHEINLIIVCCTLTECSRASSTFQQCSRAFSTFQECSRVCCTLHACSGSSTTFQECSRVCCTFQFRSVLESAARFSSGVFQSLLHVSVRECSRACCTRALGLFRLYRHLWDQVSIVKLGPRFLPILGSIPEKKKIDYSYIINFKFKKIVSQDY